MLPYDPMRHNVCQLSSIIRSIEGELNCFIPRIIQSVKCVRYEQILESGHRLVDLGRPMVIDWSLIHLEKQSMQSTNTVIELVIMQPNTNMCASQHRWYNNDFPSDMVHWNIWSNWSKGITRLKMEGCDCTQLVPKLLTKWWACHNK